MNLGSIGALGALQQSGGLDLSTVETSYPRIQSPSIGNFLVKESVIEYAKTNQQEDQSKPVWVLKLETLFPATSTEGKPLEPGFKATKRILLYTTPPNPEKKSEGRTTDMVLRDVSEALDGLFGEKFRKAADLNTLDLSVAKDQHVQFKISVRPEANGFAEQNEFRFVRKADPQ